MRGRYRICRLVQDILPLEKAYGYFISFYYISKVQQDQGEKVLILKPAKEFRKDWMENFPVISVPFRKQGLIPFEKNKFLERFKTVVKRWDADLIHTHISAGTYLHGAPSLPPTVHHLHGLPYLSFTFWNSLKKVVQRTGKLRDLRHDIYVDKLYKKYLKQANAVIVYCPSLKKIIAHRYNVPHEKIVVVFNGVSPVFLKPYSKEKVREELGLNKDAIYILYVGRLVEGKGILQLLKALQILLNSPKGKNIKLLVVGSKFGAENLKSLIRTFASREDFIVDIPHVSYEYMPKYYTAADIHVLNHFYVAGFPKTCLESLACGTPVIMTRNMDAEVILNQNKCGICLNNAIDHKELAQKILYLINHEDMSKEMGNCGKMIIHKRFTWSHTVKNIARVYKEVLDTA